MASRTGNLLPCSDRLDRKSDQRWKTLWGGNTHSDTGDKCLDRESGRRKVASWSQAYINFWNICKKYSDVISIRYHCYPCEQPIRIISSPLFYQDEPVFPFLHQDKAGCLTKFTSCGQNMGLRSEYEKSLGHSIHWFFNSLCILPLPSHRKEQLISPQNIWIPL